MPDSTPNIEENQDEFEDPTELIEPIESVRKVFKFWKTREAVISGEPLYRFSKSQLDKLGYLGPWTFNLVQSSIAAFPSLIITALVHLLHNIGIVGGESKPEQSNELVNTLAVPFILMLTAYLVGRASFFRSDSTKQVRTAASRIFLYLDGAYGFYPQMALTTLLTVMLLQETLKPFQSAVTFVSIWQLYIYMKTIPAELFTVMGYTRADQAVDSGHSITLFSEKKEVESPLVVREYPPIWKYRLAILVVIPVVSIVVYILITILGALLEPLVALFK